MRYYMFPFQYFTCKRMASTLLPQSFELPALECATRTRSLMSWSPVSGTIGAQHLRCKNQNGDQQPVHCTALSLWKNTIHSGNTRAAHEEGRVQAPGSIMIYTNESETEVWEWLEVSPLRQEGQMEASQVWTTCNVRTHTNYGVLFSPGTVAVEYFDYYYD